MAVPDAVAGLAAIPGVRTAAQLGEPSPDPSASAGALPVTPALANLVPDGLRRGTAVSVSGRRDAGRGNDGAGCAHGRRPGPGLIYEAGEVPQRRLNAASLPLATPIGDLWGLLLDVSRFPLPGMGTARPIAIEVSPTTSRAHNVPVSVHGVPQDLAYVASASDSDPDAATAGYAEERRRVTDFLGRYPSLVGWEFQAPEGNPIGLRLGSDTAEIPVVWPNPGNNESEEAVLDRHTIQYRGHQRLAFPVVGGASEPAHPFLLWWAAAAVGDEDGLGGERGRVGAAASS